MDSWLISLDFRNMLGTELRIGAGKPLTMDEATIFVREQIATLKKNGHDLYKLRLDRYLGG